MGGGILVTCSSGKTNLAPPPTSISESETRTPGLYLARLRRPPPQTVSLRRRDHDRPDETVCMPRLFAPASQPSSTSGPFSHPYETETGYHMIHAATSESQALNRNFQHLVCSSVIQSVLRKSSTTTTPSATSRSKYLMEKDPNWTVIQHRPLHGTRLRRTISALDTSKIGPNSSSCQGSSTPRHAHHARWQDFGRGAGGSSQSSATKHYLCPVPNSCRSQTQTPILVRRGICRGGFEDVVRRWEGEGGGGPWRAREAPHHHLDAPFEPAVAVKESVDFTLSA